MTIRANHDLVDISCEIIGETEKAFKIFDGGRVRCWLPKSLIEYDEGNKVMTMPEWLAKQEELI